MTLNELMAKVAEMGISLEPRLRFEAPTGTITSNLRDELSAHKDEILAYLLGPEGLDSLRRLHDLYHATCFELAETLGWPELRIDPPKTIVRGEANWRLYLNKASIPELRDQVLPRLRSMLDEIPPPERGRL